LDIAPRAHRQNHDSHSRRPCCVVDAVTQVY